MSLLLKRKSLIAILILGVLLTAVIVFSQGRYSRHSQLGENTLPSFSLEKIQKMINADIPDPETVSIIPETGEEIFLESWSEELPLATFNALSVPEKFTYTMLHGEEFRQNSNYISMRDAALSKKVGKHYYFEFRTKGQSFWSKRQLKFLHGNRAAVIELIRKTMREDAHVGENLKATILELKAYELIPDLLKHTKVEPLDYNLFTLLIVLMDQDNFAPIRNLSIYHAALNAEKTVYSSFVPITKQEQDDLVRTTRYYYKTKKH